MTQELLDDIIRREAQAEKGAVEDLMNEDKINQIYLLSNGKVLIIDKTSGHGMIRASVSRTDVIREF